MWKKKTGIQLFLFMGIKQCNSWLRRETGKWRWVVSSCMYRDTKVNTHQPAWKKELVNCELRPCMWRWHSCIWASLGDWGQQCRKDVTGFSLNHAKLACKRWHTPARVFGVRLPVPASGGVCAAADAMVHLERGITCLLPGPGLPALWVSSLQHYVNSPAHPFLIEVIYVWEVEHTFIYPVGH